MATPTQIQSHPLLPIQVHTFERESPERDLEPPPLAKPIAAAPKRSRAKILLPILAAAALTAGGVSWALTHGKETTDDAQVEGHVANVSPRIAGQVKRVLVKDNQEVRAGDVLVELDDRDYATRSAAAKADLAAAVATLHSAETQLTVAQKSASSNLVVARGGVSQAAALEGTTRAAIDQARADIVVAESRRALTRLELDRSAMLLKQGAAPRAELDNRQAAFDQAEAALQQAQSRLVSAQANIRNSAGSIESARGRLLSAQLGPDQVEAAKAQVELARARVDQAQAAFEQAELNLSYTKLKAETSGLVARRSVELGQSVSPDRPLMAIVPLDDTWIVANFKEDQLAGMRAGQSVTVSIDSYAGKRFHGKVDSLAAGTGSRFSLLPADNASGNFTKVVQRVPVLVRLDDAREVALRPGMSATVTVLTK
jgi:membrane fusion protein (multidrug efflux system)